ncbi:MAG: hypothetical protein QM756_42210 [Polyangiaceae bacterium]
MRGWFWVGGSALAMVACGGSASPAPLLATPNAVVTNEKAPPAPRAASSDLRKYWAFGDADVQLYADLRGLLQTELMKGLVPAALDSIGAQLPPEQRACIDAVTANAEELAIADSWWAVRFDAKGVPDLHKACLSMLRRAAAEAGPSGAEAYTINEDVLMLLDSNVALFGSKTSLERALQAKQAPQSWPERLALAPDQYVAWTAQVRRVENQRFAYVPELDGTTASGGLRITPREFALDAHVALPKEELAQKVVDTVESWRAQAQTMPERPQAQLLGRLLSAFTLRRTGGALDIALRLQGTATEQAKHLGGIVALATYSTRRYVTQAKTTEARVNLAQIARGILVSQPGSGKKSKLFALPPVPNAVPSGEKYQSQASDWQAWKRIAFSLSEPQYYQYRVELAKDGRSADIVARGDLDGDGQLSEFRLHLALDEKGTLSIADDLIENNPEE